MLPPLSTLSRNLEQPSLLGSNVATSLLLRGGSQVAQQAETVDSLYTRSAIGYFNNLRVPAAVLMSIIMKEMFQLQQSPAPSMRKWDRDNGIDRSKNWRILRYSYLLLMILAFSLETFTIFVATQVLTQLATAQRVVPLNSLEVDPEHAERAARGLFGKKNHDSMIDFLLKNFEFEYATCRLYFVTGLLSFAVATSLRVRYALRKYSDLSMSGMCCLLTVICGMLTYTNATTITYGGYVNLLKRQLQLSIKFLQARVKSGPLSVVTLILGCLTLVFAIMGAVSPEFDYFEEDDDPAQQQPKRRW